jgi:hypothetical protein
MAVEAGKPRISGVEGASEALPAVFVGLIEIDQLGHLLAPVLGAGFAQRLEVIKAPHDLGKALHLPLIGRIDGKGGGGEGENEEEREEQGFENCACRHPLPASPIKGEVKG